MKTYKIQVFDKDNNLWLTMISQHVDASRNVTLFYENLIDEFQVKEFTLPEKIDHINIFEGLITIYYTSGKFIEITRNDKQSYCVPGTHHGVNKNGQKY